MEPMPEKMYYVDLPQLVDPVVASAHAQIRRASSARRAVETWWLQNRLGAALFALAFALAVVAGLAVSSL